MGKQTSMSEADILQSLEKSVEHLDHAFKDACSLWGESDHKTEEILAAWGAADDVRRNSQMRVYKGGAA